MREDAIEIDLAFRDEVGTFTLSKGREGPRPDEAELLSKHVLANVEGDGASLADKADCAPGSSSPHRLQSCLRGSAAIECHVHPATPSQCLQ